MSYAGYRAELDLDSEFYPGAPWPGYMEAPVFKKALLKDYEMINEKSQFGDIYIFGDEDDILINGEKAKFQHAGICLENEMFFEKDGYDGVFQERELWSQPIRYTGVMTFRKK